MTTAPDFTEKLIGFRMWQAVEPAVDAIVDPDASDEVLRLAAMVAHLRQRDEQMREMLDALQERLKEKEATIDSLAHGHAPVRSDPTYAAVGTGGVVSASHSLAPALQVNIGEPLRNPADPGLWTGGHTWWPRDGAVKARCQRAIYGANGWARRPGRHELPPHDAPHPDCVCGLHAMYEPEFDGWMFGVNQIIGAVAAWGRIEAHAKAFRAEYMQPVALGYEPFGPPNQTRLVRALARMYGIAAVPSGELETHARRFGRPIPQDYRGRPKPPPPDPRIATVDMRASEKAACTCPSNFPGHGRGSAKVDLNCPFHGTKPPGCICHTNTILAPVCPVHGSP